MCNKIERYWIKDVTLNWIISYLAERSQFVCNDNVCSPERKITCWVPQGSTLGTLIFMLYINDIMNVSERFFPPLLADDTNVSINSQDLDKLTVCMNEELITLYVWLQANKLLLNVKQS